MREGEREGGKGKVKKERGKGRGGRKGGSQRQIGERSDRNGRVKERQRER